MTISAQKQALQDAIHYVRSVRQGSPRLGMVLGSGLSSLAAVIEDGTTLHYSQIPQFPQSRVKGHEGALHLGKIEGLEVACLAGRVHGYEGHPPERVVFGVRLLAGLGCNVVVLTNAAGAVSRELLPGSLMLISDHLNLTGSNPLTGWYEESPRFVDMSDAYDSGLQSLALRCAQARDLTVARGVYAGLTGPSYETPAEVRMLGILGASAVGMSTVHETIALRDLGVRVLGVSCITNTAAGLEGAVLDHEHVQAVARTAHGQLQHLLIELAKQLRQ